MQSRDGGARHARARGAHLRAAHEGSAFIVGRVGGGVSGPRGSGGCLGAVSGWVIYGFLESATTGTGGRSAKLVRVRRPTRVVSVSLSLINTRDDFFNYNSVCAPNMF